MIGRRRPDPRSGSDVGRARRRAGRLIATLSAIGVVTWLVAPSVAAQSASAAPDPVSVVAEAVDLRGALAALRDASLADREAIIARIAGSDDPQAQPVLIALLEDRLLVRDTDQQVVLAVSADADPVAMLDPFSHTALGEAPRDGFTRIGTNNRLRRVLRMAVARYTLSSPDAGTRLSAVRDLAHTLDETVLALLRQQAMHEADAAVRAEIGVALALADLDGTEPAGRLAAVATLASHVRPDVRNRLAALLEDNPEGAPLEADALVREAATAAVRRIDRWIALYSAVETLFFGLSLGSVLVLIGIGLTVTFGVMGVINMAHGELMMLGAYTTYVVQQLLPDAIDASVVIAVPAAFMIAGAVGVVIERVVIRRLYGRPLETLLATFGVSLILQQLVRSLFTATNRAVQAPAWMSGTLQLTEVLGVTYNRLYIVLFTLLVVWLVRLVLQRTRLGLEIRAVSQNRAMARAMGIRSARVDALTFGLGSGIAGVAGVALSQLTNVGPNLGQAYIIDSFMVVVFGGVGSLWGTLIGGLTLGVVNTLLEPYAGAVLAKIAVLLGLILFIQRRPRGLFPQAGRAAEAHS